MIHPLIHLHSERYVPWREIKSANTYTVDANTHTNTHTQTHALTHTNTRSHIQTDTCAQTFTHTYTRATYAHKHAYTWKLFSTFYVIYLFRTPISGHICANQSASRLSAGYQLIIPRTFLLT